MVHRIKILILFPIALASLPQASASGFLRFQHGGRGTAEAGTGTAVADDASSISRNPAAAALLPGLQITGGLDFNAATDDYDSPSGGSGSKHLIQFPPALYGTWRLPEDRVPLAFGVGIDSPAWYVQDWTAALFPGRFLTAKTEARLLQLHPVVAYKLGDAWSVGAGIRYVWGTYGIGDNAVLVLPSQDGTHAVEVDRLAEGQVDGFGLDAGVLVAGAHWSAGATFRTKVDLEGNGDVRQTGRDVPPDPVLAESLGAVLAGRSAGIQTTLPAEIALGLGWRPVRTLQLQIDAVSTDWSAFDDGVAYEADAFRRPSRRRRWDDTLSLRASVEVDVTDHWRVYGGLAHEPSPVPAGLVEPGFPRSDASVAAAGFGYEAGNMVFDIGYSLHLYGDRTVAGQETNPDVRSTYGARDQVFAASVRWKLDRH